MHTDPGRSFAASAGREASFSGKAWRYLLPRKRFRPLSAHRSVKSCGQVYFFHSRILRPVRRFPLFLPSKEIPSTAMTFCAPFIPLFTSKYLHRFFTSSTFLLIGSRLLPGNCNLCFIHTFQPTSAAVRLAVGCHRRGLYLTDLHSVRTAAHKCAALRKL